jgi:hypothetical protein
MILAEIIAGFPDWLTVPALGIGLVAGAVIGALAFRGFK